MKSSWLRPVFLALVLLVTGTGHAGAESAQTLKYDVYAGGFHAFKAEITQQESRGRYEIGLTSSTSPTFKLIAPWTGDFKTEGWVQDGARWPERYESSSKSSDKLATKSIVYDRKGRLVSFKAQENDKDKTPNPLNRDLAPVGIVDVLTAAQEAMDRLNAGKSCEGSSLIFDGDRNFTLSFKDEGAQQLEPTKYNIYHGEVEACSFAMTPEKGKWKKKLRGWLALQDQARRLKSEPMAYFARLDPAGSYVPVRIQIKTNYGSIIMHLTGVASPATMTAIPVKKTN